MMRSSRRSRLASVLGMVVLSAMGVGAATFLVSPGVEAATTRAVCADDLYVRKTPGGIIIGTLFRGQHFRVDHYSPSGIWAYGFAYGHVNQYGWVMAQYLCPP